MANFLAETRVERDPGGDGRYRSTLSPDWAVWGPNGGYVAAIALRAAMAESRLPRPASFHCHFLAVGEFAAVELRATSLGGSKRAESLRVEVTQNGRAIVVASAWMVDDGLQGYAHDFAAAPELPRPGALRGYQDLAGDEYAQWYPIWRSIEGRPLRWREPPGRPEWQTWGSFQRAAVDATARSAARPSPRAAAPRARRSARAARCEEPERGPPGAGTRVPERRIHPSVYGSASSGSSAMSEAPRVLTSLDDEGVLLVTLNRPAKKNAFDDAQWDALASTLNEARRDARIAVVLLTGAGGNFSSGVDLASFAGGARPARADGFASAFHACEAAVLGFDKPLLAAVTGVAVGGGCTIAIACDVVYVGESLRMRLPFANLGLVPEIASSYTLQSAIGRQRAAELMLSAEWIDARRALEVGMAARCFPDGELLAAALAKAREIAQWPIPALVGIKRTLLVAHRAGIEAALAVESEGMRALAGSPENIEAVTAFLQKRPPDFKQFRKPAAS